MSTKIDIFSGFLGAGKTTLIKKLIGEAYSGEQLVLIENEFGEIGIDGGFLKDSGVQVTEMNSGCICCSLVGDFGEALKKVLDTYHPDRIIIEPSGVGKLSDVIRAVQNLNLDGIVLNSFTTVADATKIKVYMKNFGEFYNNQIEHAGAIVLSRTDGLSEERLDTLVAMLRALNSTAAMITTPWDAIDGKTMVEAIEHTDTLESVLDELAEEAEDHHHDDDDDDECCHHHHDDNDDDDDDDDDDQHEHHHDHHHEHDGCCCGHDHHHHHADEVFTSFGTETTHKFTADTVREALSRFDEDSSYGTVLRAKGIVEGQDGKWIHFDYVPGQVDVRNGSAGTIGRLCVIGSALNEEKLRELFGL